MYVAFTIINYKMLDSGNIHLTTVKKMDNYFSTDRDTDVTGSLL